MTGRMIPITRKQVEAFETLKNKRNEPVIEIPDPYTVLAEGYQEYGKTEEKKAEIIQSDFEELSLTIAARNGKTMTPATLNKIMTVVKDHLKNDKKSE